ncbi:hypothetical protein FISHEDRAFT_59877 [Fistulina hepatica ATCC 64428]|uniref:Heterokaryon incompatibility domain-containing protein n=1 Tax=Fistulina hepatica ATCC 64428 TaxID=1128425 RepID=A0A0D7AAW7_9AGAR|nr:hypothetical protein FISHEDRAFT_59877 [Fistulina hepatica ATCC 64428]
MSLFLLVPISEVPDGNLAPYLELRGQRWAVENFQVSEENRPIPAYTCISYVWGSGRTPNSMHVTVEMSDRTLPALLTAMVNCPCAAYWIDAFCIPSGDPAGKRATLQSMGYIYSRAEQVVCITSVTSFKALQELSSLDSSQLAVPRTGLLEALDKNPWIRSVWTYQEVVNSSRLLICGEGLAQTLLAHEFLNRFSQFIVRYCHAQHIPLLSFYRMYPLISAFEDLILDWRTANYTERSAYQVMSGMEKRHWDKDANFFYSSIGALTQVLVERTPASSLEALAESFMSTCENKHDFSFIFTSGRRDPRDGLRWRPTPQILRSILPWPCHGAQDGHRTPRGAVLKDMVQLPGASAISADTRAAILSFLKVDNSPELTDARIARLCFDTFSRLGFRGDKEPIMITANGVFFAQDASAILSCPNAELWISSTLKWHFGCLGLAVWRDHENAKRYAPAVFIGIVEEGENLLKQDLPLD